MTRKYNHSRRWVARSMNKLIKELSSIPIGKRSGRVGDVIIGLECLVEDLQRQYIYDSPKPKKITRKR